MSSFRTRLQNAALAGGAAWLTGWLVSFPFDLPLAWRYVDGNAARLPSTLAEGVVVWAGFTLLMGMVCFMPLLAALLLLAPGWIVRRRRVLIPAAPLLGMTAIYYRMGFLNMYHVRHPEGPRAFLFAAPDVFVGTFALVLVWVYVVLARTDLAAREEQQ